MRRPGSSVAAAVIAALSAVVVLASAASASAQQGFSPFARSPGGQPPGTQYPAGQSPSAQGRNPACVQLEGQLAAFDRGTADPAQADLTRRLDDAARRQQSDLDRLTAQARRAGCEGGGFFALFSGQPPQCAALNNQIQQARATLDRTMSDLERAQSNTGADREGQRRSIIGALAQNDCGPQYRELANQGGGFFDRLFGPGTIINPNPAPTSDTYETMCVRTCDGYYFPISYSTVPGRFADDDRTCHQLCPAADVALYSHRTSGEDMSQAVSINGQPYAQLPTAFAYRKQISSSCSCRSAGQTWAQALKQLDDRTIEQGDIVVNEERAKQLSQPQTDAQGKPIKQPPPPRGGAAAPASTKATTPSAAIGQDAAAVDAPADTEPGKRHVRTVGPPFIQAQ